MNQERRHKPDRRQQATTIWDSLVGAGERVYVRRHCERAGPHCLDRFHWSTLAWILLLLTFCLLDGLLTLELIDTGCHEANPIMHYFLSMGPMHFLIVKYLLTATGLPVLVLFGGYPRVRHVLPILVGLYVALITYQVMLFDRVCEVVAR